MRNMLIKLSPVILFITLNIVAISVIVMATTFVIQGEADRDARAAIVGFWAFSVPITAMISFIDTSMPRGLMRDILDLMGRKQ